MAMVAMDRPTCIDDDILFQKLRDRALVTGRAMRLASGRTSDIYFDMKMAMFDPDTINLIADAILREVKAKRAFQVGGLEMGAVPIVGAVVCKSFNSYPVRGFIVRKVVKEHGTQKRIEGCFEPGDATILLDDVTTTGGSILKAVQAVRDEGGHADHVVTVVDREEGAREALAEAGVELIALYTRSDFRP